MRETIVRVLSGSVYLGLIIALAYAPVIWSVIVFLIIAMMAGGEFGRLFWKASNGRVEALVYTISGIVIGASAPLLIDGVTPVSGLLLPMMIFLFSTMVILRNSSNIRSAMAGLVMGAVLVGIPFAILPQLTLYGPEIFLGGFILVWVNDTFAYVWGRLLGKQKLLPSVSPGKTIEGFIGGSAMSVVCGYILGVVWEQMPGWQWMVTGLLLSLAATLGDLLESALKRQRGVKDSGTIMPGHGGVLDRFDGLLLAIPMYFILIHLFGAA